MSVAGTPRDWEDFFATDFVPTIIELILATWLGMAKPSGDAHEGKISVDLCCALRKNRTARDLMFQIRTQDFELDLDTGELVGIKDIVFSPLINREDVYFCLECKRLNVVRNGTVRPYASEYVREGMVRFVVGQYSKGVRHGGMLGYVLDGDVPGAMANVESNIRSRSKELGMTPPAGFQPSSIRPADAHARETHHRRQHEQAVFRLHHLFVTCPVNEGPPTQKPPPGKKQPPKKGGKSKS